LPIFLTVIYKFFWNFKIRNEKYRKTPVYHFPVPTENGKFTGFSPVYRRKVKPCFQQGFFHSRLEMATGIYPSGIGHPYPYPLELSFTCRITRTRTRVGKYFHTRTRRVIYTRRVTRTRKAYPRITYKYHIFIWKIIHFKLKLEWVWSRIWRRVQQYIY